MKFSRIILVILFSFYLISCQNGFGEKSDVEPKIDAVPSTEYQKTEKTFPNRDKKTPVEKPLDNEVKKKKLKAVDTLKPVVAIP